MRKHRVFSLVLIVACFAPIPAGAQEPPRESVSSDDISVAEGLQLPTYGHLWVLDSWKGVRELVRLRPPDAGTEDPGFSLKLRHAIEFKGEAARVRLHDVQPVFFLRGVSGSDDGRSDLVIVNLVLDGQHRVVPKEAMAELKQHAKNEPGQNRTGIRIKQQRVGATDWYRLLPQQKLPEGEYALVPLPNSPGFAAGEVFDFAIDPQAPENPDPLRSEENRGSE